MLDENGNPPLRPLAEHPEMGVRRSAAAGLAALGAGSLLLLGGLPAWSAAAGLIGAGTIVVAGSLIGPLARRASRRAWLRARARRIRDRACEVTQGELPRDGAILRVRGRVRVLGAVPARAGVPAVAARQDGDERACGRFAVEGPSGLAVVDDDAFEIWRPRGRDLFGRLGGVVVAGVEVEVAGPARAMPIRDAALKAAVPSNRADELAIAFDGSADEPVLVMLPS